MEKQTSARIAERRRAIADRTAQIEAELARLRVEAEELDVAERVLKRFSESAASAPANGHDDEAAASEALTLPQMVLMVLDEAKAKGRKGVSSADLIQIIRDRWKPEFTPDNVRPTLWRMVKKGRLKKRAGLYCAPASSPLEGETGAVAAPVPGNH